MGYEPLTYEDYVYPLWANILGWFIASSSVAMIPGVAIYKMIVTPGTFCQVRRVQFLIISDFQNVPTFSPVLTKYKNIIRKWLKWVELLGFSHFTFKYSSGFFTIDYLIHFYFSIYLS